MKLGTTPGHDLVHPELLKHLGPKALTWLADLFTRMIWKQRIPKIWQNVAKIHILLMEHTILQRISPNVEDLPSVDQAGFHRGHSTCDQVTALTTFTENGFKKTLKTGALFLDLSAAYHTIWYNGIITLV